MRLRPLPIWAYPLVRRICIDVATEEEKAEKAERLVEAAVALLAASPGKKLNTVVLNKALFYLDLVALRDLGHTVTGNTFVALHQGPVVAHYDKRVVRKLETLGLAKQTIDGKAKPIALVSEVPHFKRISQEERAIATQVATVLAGVLSSEASTYSHRNPGWQLAYSVGQKVGAPPEPINMHLAMQQIAERDPWIDAPSDEDFAEAVERVEIEDGEAW